MSINQKPKTIASVPDMKNMQEILIDTRKLLANANGIASGLLGTAQYGDTATKRKNDFKKVL